MAKTPRTRVPTGAERNLLTFFVDHFSQPEMEEMLREEYGLIKQLSDRVDQQGGLHIEISIVDTYVWVCSVLLLKSIAREPISRHWNSHQLRHIKTTWHELQQFGKFAPESLEQVEAYFRDHPLPL